MLQDILQLNQGQLHNRILGIIQDNLQKKYKEEKAVKLALKKVHDEIQEMLQDNSSDSESEDGDTSSDEI